MNSSRRSVTATRLALLLATAWLVSASRTVAEENIPRVEPAPATVAEPAEVGKGKKYALIVCGLSGDAAHHQSFAETVTKLHDGLTKQFGFAEADVQVLFGDEPQEADSSVIKATSRATREELERSAARLRDTLQPADSLWVIVLGHSHFDGKQAWLNLPGPDLQQFEFAKLFAEVKAGEQMFVITVPSSGYYIKSFSAANRVIISATEMDGETNETEYPHELGRVLASPPDAKAFDIDEDGVVTVFDLYVTVARNLAQSYLERELLATEHALLDDNGDARGSEVQIDFLTEEQGGRLRPGRPAIKRMNSTADGSRAKKILLRQMPVLATTAE